MRELLQRWLIPNVMRYEVMGLAGESYDTRTRDHWIIWLGGGTWGIAEGFYSSLEAARTATELAPDGYKPCVFFYPPGKWTKEEIPPFW